MARQQVTIIFWICLLTFLYGCENKWTGVYVSHGLKKQEEYSPEFAKKQECVNWCNQQVGKAKNYDVECKCGRNCRKDEFGYIFCEKIDYQIEH